MPFMIPEILETDIVTLENEHGESMSLPADVAGDVEDGWTETERATGFIWRLQAPGYLDATEWERAESEEDARAEIESIHEVCGHCGEELDEGCEHHPTEPQEGDYVLSPTGHLGSRTAVGIVEGKHVGDFDDDDDALQAIRSRMAREKYWPNVWRQDDHGGIELAETLPDLARELSNCHNVNVLEWDRYDPDSESPDSGSASWGDLSALDRPMADDDDTSRLFATVDTLQAGDYGSTGTMGRANVKAWREQFEDVLGWIDIPGDYGSEGIAIRLDLCTADMLETVQGLADYPCIDDEALSEYETEASDEAWESWAESEFASAVLERTGWDVSECAELRQHFEEAREDAGREWFADGDGMCVRTDDVAESLNVDAPAEWDGATLDPDLLDPIELDLHRARAERKDAIKVAERLLRDAGHRTYRMLGDASEPWSIGHEARATYRCAACDATATVDVRPAVSGLAAVRGTALYHYCRTGRIVAEHCRACEERTDRIPPESCSSKFLHGNPCAEPLCIGRTRFGGGGCRECGS